MATAASKNGLVDETRLFLQTYASSGSIDQARTDLITGGLPQRSRTTRVVIVRMIQSRLTRWNPPAWVLDDLVVASTLDDMSRLRVLLLLHYARQETLIYDTVQHLLVPHWQRSEIIVTRDDVQAFLDLVATQHPEVAAWSYETRIKIAGNVLTTLRDYALLVGNTVKRIAEPPVDLTAVQHLIRLLREEGVAEQRIADHPDWRIWLLFPERVRGILASLDTEVHASHG